MGASLIWLGSGPEQRCAGARARRDRVLDAHADGHLGRRRRRDPAGRLGARWWGTRATPRGARPRCSRIALPWSLPYWWDPGRMDRFFPVDPARAAISGRARGVPAPASRRRRGRRVRPRLLRGGSRRWARDASCADGHMHLTGGPAPSAHRARHAPARHRRDSRRRGGRPLPDPLPGGHARAARRASRRHAGGHRVAAALVNGCSRLRGDAGPVVVFRLVARGRRCVRRATGLRPKASRSARPPGGVPLPAFRARSRSAGRPWRGSAGAASGPPPAWRGVVVAVGFWSLSFGRPYGLLEDQGSRCARPASPWWATRGRAGVVCWRARTCPRPCGRSWLRARVSPRSSRCSRRSCRCLALPLLGLIAHALARPRTVARVRCDPVARVRDGELERRCAASGLAWRAVAASPRGAGAAVLVALALALARARPLARAGRSWPRRSRPPSRPFCR